MRILKAHLLIALCIGCTAPASADEFSKVGRTAFQFLKIGVGARQVALGEASIAIVRDANSAFWNPAAISGVETGEVSFNYNKWLAGLNYMSSAVAFRWPEVGVFAVSVGYLGYGNLTEALVTSPTGSADTRTGQTFGGHDMQFGLSYSHQFSEALSIGVTAKYVEEQLFTYKTGVPAFDIGTFYDTGFKGIRFAMSFQNFASSVKFLSNSNREEGYDIPLIFRIGMAFDLFSSQGGFINLGNLHRFTVAFDAISSNDYGERWHLGGEYLFSDFLALRGGYRFNYAEGNLSLGVGVQQRLGDMMLRLDYSYVAFEFLEAPHRLSLTVGF